MVILSAFHKVLQTRFTAEASHKDKDVFESGDYVVLERNSDANKAIKRRTPTSSRGEDVFVIERTETRALFICIRQRTKRGNVLNNKNTTTLYYTKLKRDSSVCKTATSCGPGKSITIVGRAHCVSNTL
ncbi:MAG: uncharacterized protein A8A55_2370 [Amphiamblys sp. WSBS2006]|nr:MAG: uncharacterized protein A8A55_2370 [Amphiamblys sp. WSBS2006]